MLDWQLPLLHLNLLHNLPVLHDVTDDDLLRLLLLLLLIVLRNVMLNLSGRLVLLMNDRLLRLWLLIKKIVYQINRKGELIGISQAQI